jgi:hypothetical protein
MPNAYLYDPEAERLRPLDWAPARALRWAAWRRDGALMLAVGNGGLVQTWDGSALGTLDGGTKQNLRGAAWSPDGSMALLVGNRGAVQKVEGETVRELPSGSVENLRRVAWHPGGTWALIVGNSGAVLRYDRGRDVIEPLATDRAHTLRSVAFRPDGAYALVGAFASRWVGYPRPHSLYRCDGRYMQALLASDEEDDFVAIDYAIDSTALVVGYAWKGDGRVVNKALLYDGSAWGTRVWAEGTGSTEKPPRVVLGGAWQPGEGQALLAGEGGLTLLLRRDGGIEELESETQDNLVGPFWKPDGSAALILKGPGERVYTV